jgi:hypothetical protein
MSGSGSFLFPKNKYLKNPKLPHMTHQSRNDSPDWPGVSLEFSTGLVSVTVKEADNGSGPEAEICVGPAGELQAGPTGIAGHAGLCLDMNKDGLGNPHLEVGFQAGFGIHSGITATINKDEISIQGHESFRTGVGAGPGFGLKYDLLDATLFQIRFSEPQPSPSEAEVPRGTPSGRGDDGGTDHSFHDVGGSFEWAGPDHLGHDTGHDIGDGGHEGFQIA